MPTEAKPDCYQLLNVSRTATAQEITEAFHKLQGDFHASGKPKTTDDVDWFRQLRRAYDVLSDKERKRHYDLLGEEIPSIPTKPVGYDPANIEQMNRVVDDEIKKGRNYWIISEIVDFFLHFSRWTF